MTAFDERYVVSQHYHKQISSRLEGTCEWIFSHSAYRTWVSESFPDEVSKFLWVCGPAGYGKTVLTARLIEHFKDSLASPMAYFFSSPHALSGGQPSDIVRSWIAQIAQAEPDTLELVRGYCERDGAGSTASESDIWSVFHSIMSQKRNYSLFLDGFDEYTRLDDGRAQFLHKLKKAAERTASRIPVSSRDESDIKTELYPDTSQVTGYVLLQCRISREDVRHDITLYSRSVVDKKLPKKDENLRQSLARQLADKCEGMFLWIKLQQDHLRGGKNGKQLQDIVESMPLGLTKTYERNWKTI
ncbi:hypothetical protein K469DRAFT_217806 [Zopfia rhizophila CBS 207.26]|uniref:Nephrocystin 3-like N-terminal domain-containing protein n=1 Tax=Zopfia rhizophila CBS 207.26 TaxID=1314779 RepID=A0A6A6DW18_9PEZI|nr:hypothetical protein K469DRAFT_217806 [Zopfia rhizophila CBS 207.26]